jgi:hypothetical protein
LVQDFNDLAGEGFDPQSVHPAVRDFYERTSCYKLEAWTEPSMLMKPFLWLLVRLVSRHMDQLNFPINPLDTSRGMTSEVVPLVNQETGQRKFTGWRRKLVAVNRIIYTGLYQSETPPASNRPYVKVSFPLPLGSATVFLRPEAQPDGSLKLISDGSQMGESGFYRMVHNNETSWKVRFVHTLHEVIHVYVDEENVLRTDHSFSYLGLKVLKLHYKMQLKNLPSDSQGCDSQGCDAQGCDAQGCDAQGCDAQDSESQNRAAVDSRDAETESRRT